MEPEAPLDELLAIVARDLGASEAHIAPAEEPPAGGVVLSCDLPDGRRVVVTFDEAPPDVEARRRRLTMLVSAFTDTLSPSEAPSERGKPRGPSSRLLREELEALAKRAGAVEAVVIDAHSPVVWGSASGDVERPAGASAALEALRAGAPPLHSVGPEDIAAAVQYGLASAQGVRVDPGHHGRHPPRRVRAPPHPPHRPGRRSAGHRHGRAAQRGRCPRRGPHHRPRRGAGLRRRVDGRLLPAPRRRRRHPHLRRGDGGDPPRDPRRARGPRSTRAGRLGPHHARAPRHRRRARAARDAQPAQGRAPAPHGLRARLRLRGALVRGDLRDHPESSRGPSTSCSPSAR